MPCLILKPPVKVANVSRGRLAWYSAGLESPWEQSLASSNLALGAKILLDLTVLGILMASLTKKELAITFAPALISLLFTLAIYISYTQNPECPQSGNASQCWDFRPLLIPAFSFLTLILTLSSLYRYRLLTNEN